MRLLVLLLILASCGKNSDLPQSNVIDSKYISFDVQKISTNEIIVLDQAISVCDSESYFASVGVQNGGLTVEIPVSNKCPLKVLYKAFDSIRVISMATVRDPLKNLLITFNCPLVSVGQFNCEVEATITNNLPALIMAPLSPDHYLQKFQILLTPNLKTYFGQID